MYFIFFKDVLKCQSAEYEHDQSAGYLCFYSFSLKKIGPFAVAALTLSNFRKFRYNANSFLKAQQHILHNAYLQRRTFIYL